MLKKINADFYKKYLIISCILSSGLVSLNSTMLASVLPEISKIFGVSFGVLTIYLVDIYLLINVLLQIIAGRMGDIYGRRYVLNMAHFFLVLGSLLAIVKFNFYILVSARILMAVGGAIMVPNTIALICNETTDKRRSYILGIASSIFCLSAGFGPLLGGLMNEFFGWRSIFLINIPFLLFSWILIARKNNFVEKINGKIGLKFKNSEFIKEKIYKNRTFIFCIILIGIQNMVVYGLLFSMPFLLIRIFNEGSFEIGNIIFLLTISMAVSTFIGAKVGRQLKNTLLLLQYLLSTLLGAILLYFSLKLNLIALFVTALTLVGASVGLGYGSAQILIMSVSPNECRGLVSGLVSTIRYLGGIAGMLIFSSIVDIQNDSKFLYTNQLCILIYAGICLVSFIGLMMMLMNISRKTKKHNVVKELSKTLIYVLSVNRA